MYRYFGIVVGHMKATIALLYVIGMTTGHSAVWLGAQASSAARWVQGGIETSAGSPGNYLYIEIGRNRGHNDSFWCWPTTRTHVAHVRLFHQGTYWRVRIDGHLSHRVWLPHGVTVAALEDFSSSRIFSLALIDGHRVGGH